MRDGKGNEGENFFHFFAKGIGKARRYPLCMNKNIISALFLTLACVDVLILSQFNLNLIEALLTGSLMLISYGMGIYSGLAE
jgi:hypothetical protein